VLGDGERLGALERAMVKRVLQRGRAPRGPIAPGDAAAEPVLERAAAA
jgi:hypothetical protein